MLKKRRVVLFIFLFFFLLTTSRVFSPVRFLKVGSKIILVEIARTPKERQQGLQNRSHLAQDRGMFFIFKEEGYHSFWMKDTYIPLDIAFIDKNKVIVDIQEMIPLEIKFRYKPPK